MFMTGFLAGFGLIGIPFSLYSYLYGFKRADTTIRAIYELVPKRDVEEGKAEIVRR